MSNLQLILSLAAPLVVGLLFKSSASAGLKSLGLLAVTSIVTVVSAYIGDGNVWNADLVRDQVETFVVAVASYFGVWKPLNLTAETILPAKGIGPVD